MEKPTYGIKNEDLKKISTEKQRYVFDSQSNRYVKTDRPQANAADLVRSGQKVTR